MIVPLPQSGQGWPTKASTPPVAEGVEAIVATGAGEPGKSDRKSTRLNSSHNRESRMPSSA